MSDIVDAADRLSLAVNGRKAGARELLGGSDCKLFKDALCEIGRLRDDNERLERALLQILQLIEHPRDIYEVDIDAIQSVAHRALNK